MAASAKNLINSIPQQNFEVAGLLARLLATENIRVEFRPDVPTAWFDIRNRILVSPVWAGISQHLRDMLLVHETGHALDTPEKEWIDAIKKIAKKHYSNPTHALKAEGAIKDFLNVVEDPRIDKRQKRRYPGAKKDYVVGMQELHDRDFFGIKGKNINEMNFVDRLNIYEKGGHSMGIVFSADEQKLVDMVEACETFEEVIAATDALFAYAKEQGQMNSVTQKGGTIVLQDGDGSEGEGEEIDLDQFDEVIDNRTGSGDGDGEDGEEKDGKSGKGKGKSQDGKGSNPLAKRDQKEGRADHGNGETGLNAPKSADGKEKAKNKPKPFEPAPTGNGAGGEPFIPQSATRQAEEKNIKDMAVATTDGGKYVYLNVPSFDIRNIVDDYSIVIPQMEQTKPAKNYAEKYSADLAKWKNREKPVISYMIKEFEMRKAADTYARAQVARTGILDMNALTSYKFAEDIFKKAMTVPNGKNHGFVMLLDWSGSMYDNFQYTLQQLFSLCLFCKQASIPFEVYSFRPVAGQGSFKQPIQERDLRFASFKLRNILSSRMNTSMLKRAYEAVWRAAFVQVNSDPMASTPLNQALLAFDEVVEMFKKKSRAQIVSTIVLTDGSSDPCQGYMGDDKDRNTKVEKYFLRDSKTGRLYALKGHPSAYENTNVFTQILKDRTQANLVSFYLYSGGFGSAPVPDAIKNPQAKLWNEEGWMVSKVGGYDEAYVLSVNAQAKNAEDKSLNINGKMKVDTAANAFTEFNKRAKTSKRLLSSFIDHIAREFRISKKAA